MPRLSSLPASAFALALLSFASSPTAAQTTPPIPGLITLSVSAGGAIGERLAVTLNGVPRTHTYAIAVATAAAPARLLPPWVVIQAGPMSSLAPTATIPIPNVAALVGQTFFFQAVSANATTLWTSAVLAWRVAPNPSPRFVDWNISLPFNGALGEAIARLASGELLVAGGSVGVLTPATGRAWLVDVAQRTTTRIGDLNTPRVGGVIAAFADGSAIVVGGNSTAPIERFDPATRTFSNVASIGTLTRARATAFRDLGGREYALITGSWLWPGGPQRAAFVYDARTRAVTTVMMNTARSEAAHVALPGAVLVTGGHDVNNNDLADAELYVHATGRFHRWGSLAVGRRDHGAIAIDSRRVAIVAGWANPTFERSLEVFDVASMQSTLLPFSLARSHRNPTLARLADGSILIDGVERVDGTGVSAIRPISHPSLPFLVRVVASGTDAFAFTGHKLYELMPR